MSERIWEEIIGDGPLVATALHDGHEVREELLRLLALDDSMRLREEDPFTALWTSAASTRIIGRRSRFEVDLNRPREQSVYLTPDDAWGLQVWRDPLAAELRDKSLSEYDTFYDRLREILDAKVQLHGCFTVFDLHSYNHRRSGPDATPAPAEENPQVNIGTGTMDRERWASVVERFMSELRSFDFPGGSLDVRENVRFRGGHMARWIHETYPRTGCVLSIEFKKFFMDEWSGEPDAEIVDAIGSALAWTAHGVVEQLGERDV